MTGLLLLVAVTAVALALAADWRADAPINDEED